MRHSDKVELACRSNMANSFCSGIIETTPAGVLRRPSYYVMQLYARHARPVPLRIEQAGDGPDLFACSSMDGRSLVIFAINSRAEPVDWSYQFEGFAAPVRALKAEMVGDTEDARQPDVMNHWTSPRRVRTTGLPLRPAQKELVLPALSVMALEFEASRAP